MSKKGWIFDIKELAVHDGPGIRSTVFLKGCPLRCRWCHNPEGLSGSPQIMKRSGCVKCKKCEQACTHAECRTFGVCVRVCPQNLVFICGEEISAKDLAEKLKSNSNIFEKSGGGITISGGEPLMQPDFLLELLDELKPLHRIVETSGYGGVDLFQKLIESADIIYIDIKLADSIAHRHWTGADNTLILKNLNQIVKSGRSFVVRIPVIPGVNDSKENMVATSNLIKEARGRICVQLLPYNSFAGAKYSAVNKTYQPEFDTDRPAQIFVEPFVERGIPCMVL